MRFTKWLRGSLSTTTLVVAAAALGSGGIGCAEETFKCCECQFAMPAECTPTNPALMPTSVRFCGCPEGDTYTYEECGVFCQDELPNVMAATPDLVGVASDPPFTCMAGTMPAILPDPQKTIAKNACVVGNPVGDPP